MRLLIARNGGHAPYLTGDVALAAFDDASERTRTMRNRPQAYVMVRPSAETNPAAKTPYFAGSLSASPGSSVPHQAHHYFECQYQGDRFTCRGPWSAATDPSEQAIITTLPDGRRAPPRSTDGSRPVAASSPPSLRPLSCWPVSPPCWRYASTRPLPATSRIVPPPPSRQCRRRQHKHPNRPPPQQVWCCPPRM